MIATVRKARRLEGEVRLPGDKSISHRALILGAIASGESRFRGLSSGADVRSTAGCIRALGVEVTESRVRGAGMHGLKAPRGPLECGNSGTTMRLLAGLLAPQPFTTELRGDDSLTSRPMDRVVTPLRAMGATASWPPLVVGGRGPLHGIDYVMPVASAQVKSAVLLAGLFADSRTTIVEPVATRNHTELMLEAMGATVLVDGRRVQVSPAERLAALDMDIPGDLSAASFWLVASGLISNARVRIQNAGTNPTRMKFMELLSDAGIAIAVEGARTAGGEPVADLVVGTAAELRPVTIDDAMAAEMIDELPVLAVAATRLPGTSRITGAAELRVKESDRIAAMAEGLAAMGADITALDDGWVITGPRHLEGARVRSHRDHRVAMALAIAGLLADGTTEIDDAECVDISYPGFFDQLESLC